MRNSKALYCYKGFNKWYPRVEIAKINIKNNKMIKIIDYNYYLRLIIPEHMKKQCLYQLGNIIFFEIVTTIHI